MGRLTGQPKNAVASYATCVQAPTYGLGQASMQGQSERRRSVILLDGRSRTAGQWAKGASLRKLPCASLVSMIAGVPVPVPVGELAFQGELRCMEPSLR